MAQITDRLKSIQEARHHDPFDVLGRHKEHGQTVIRVFLPNAQQVALAEGNRPMQRVEGTDIFEWWGDDADLPAHYRMIWKDSSQYEHIGHDPYSFAPQLSDFDLHLFGEGKHWHAYRMLGAHAKVVDGIAGVLFSVWAPNAQRVSVVGSFNRWDGRQHPMRVHNSRGVWELFIPDIRPGELYKFEIRNRDSGQIGLKADPYGQHFELRPKTASIVVDAPEHVWADQAWLEKRKKSDWLHQPLSIFEVHLGSWRRGEEGEFLNYRELAHQLVAYVKDLGFTHVELMPITEHPYDKSWGYQTTGYYAPTSRYGTPDDFRYFVDYCHQHDIGVLLDWVPAHFPKDAHGLARFDGTCLYEHSDPRKGEHMDWATLIYNYRRHEVKNFLLSSAMFWLEELHLDGLRVDAVASMLYLDYSRTEWIPNEHGGRENLEAIEFLQELNKVMHGEHPGVLIMAEESTAWGGVTKPVYLGGLGFSLKWNMGWMNDTLSYIKNDPVHRKYHHNNLTFSMLYAFSENFLLPFSHDEVVHGKQNMLNKVPGDEWQRFANLRVLYTYQFTHPGKKLLFMGTEFGQGVEWNSGAVLDWYVLDYPLHHGLQRMIKDLNALYAASPELHRYEFDWKGFEWLDCNDAERSVLSFLRRTDASFYVVILNFTPVPREGYRLGVPETLPAEGTEHPTYVEIFNSDSAYYGGSNLGNGLGALTAEPQEWNGRPYSLRVTVPPLGAVILKPVLPAPRAHLEYSLAEPETAEGKEITQADTETKPATQSSPAIQSIPATQSSPATQSTGKKTAKRV